MVINGSYLRNFADKFKLAYFDLFLGTILQNTQHKIVDIL